MSPSLERLVEAVLAEEDGAWQVFWQAVEPKLHALLRRRGPLGRMAENEDHVRNIVLEVLAALRADGHAKLKKYAEARGKAPTLPFLAWLAVVARRIAIDYMRRQGEYLDLRGTRGADVKGRWVTLVSLRGDSQGQGARPPVTNLAAVKAVLEHAEAHLLPEQGQALARWAQGETYEDIARGLDLEDAKAAERLVQGAIERLRRHFRTEGSR
jgi:DNA-directed RNA polymerase specialized sigma24 family protein